MSTGTDGTRTARPGLPTSPPAARARRATWRDPRVVIGVAVVSVSVLVGGLLFAGADDAVSVWAARSPLRAGQPVTGDDLVPTETRFADAASADRYISAAEPPPDGATLSRDVGAGELLPRDAVVGSKDTAMTEVPLSVATDAVPATISTGSAVDVWVTTDPDSALTQRAGRRPARLVLDDVVVVSAARAGSSLGPTATRQVIVGLTADQADGLPQSLAALQSGTIVLTRQQ